MLKLRLYIIAGKFDRTRLLMAQLKQYFEACDRPYMRIQLHMLQTMIDRRSGRCDWRAELTATKEAPDGSCNKPLSGVFHYKPYFSRRRAAS